MGIIGGERNTDKKDKNDRSLNINVCDMIISKEGDDADRSIGGYV